LVEFALVAPVFLALLFGILEFGRALWTLQALQETAIAGARCMALPQTNCAAGTPSSHSYDPTMTTAYIQQVANQWGVSLTTSNITPVNTGPTNCGASGFSQVSLTFTFQSVVPILVDIASGGIPLAATACFPNNP
jgi:Flp pilus assembly protein TadG